MPGWNNIYLFFNDFPRSWNFLFDQFGKFTLTGFVKFGRGTPLCKIIKIKNNLPSVHFCGISLMIVTSK